MCEEKQELDEIKIGGLMANIGRLHAKRAHQIMEQVGLYRGQAFLLMILSRQDGLTHSEIAEKLEVSPAAATKVIKRMEELNYLQRRSDPVDERVSRVFLEAEGRALNQRIKQAFDQIDRVLVNNLSPEEQSVLVELLLKMYHNLLEQPAGVEEDSLKK
jgi:DNA-binding MarR family transcriptional regulator